jgi:hypothetical protein
MRLDSDHVHAVSPCRVSVSSSGRYIAAADGAGQVLLYGFLPYKGTFLKWDLVGKFRAHHSECCAVLACSSNLAVCRRSVQMVAAWQLSAQLAAYTLTCRAGILGHASNAVCT